jgi:hypothetical protein
LHLLCGAEEGDVVGDVALVEDLVRAPVLGKAVEGEVDLIVGGPMVDGVDAAGELGREVVAVEELVKVAVGSRLETTTGAVITSPSARATPSTRPSATTILATFTWRRSSPPCLSSRARMCLEIVPIPPSTFDIVAPLGEASAKARHMALPGV